MFCKPCPCSLFKIYVDEAHFVFESVRRAWNVVGDKGSRPKIDKSDRVSVIAGMNCNELLCYNVLATENCDTHTFKRFMAELKVNVDRRGIGFQSGDCLIVLDNAKYHEAALAFLAGQGWKIIK